jgi:hypothetical protein
LTAFLITLLPLAAGVGVAIDNAARAPLFATAASHHLQNIKDRLHHQWVAELSLSGLPALEKLI